MPIEMWFRLLLNGCWAFLCLVTVQPLVAHALEVLRREHKERAGVRDAVGENIMKKSEAKWPGQWRHGPYVWSAYLITLIVLVLTCSTRLMARRQSGRI